MRVFSLIMAGGKEMRFGPIKEYLGSKTQMQIEGQEGIIFETIKRNADIFKRENTFLITNQKQEAAYQAIIRRKNEKFKENFYLPDTNIIFEPEPKGTSYCILFSALRFRRIFNNEKIVLCIFPSDAYIPNYRKNIVSYGKAINAAIKIAKQGQKMVTIGMEVSYPATAYGYINFVMDYNNYKVIDFQEKPDEDKAISFFNKKEEYFWNSGIFVVELDYLIELFKEFCPKGTFDSFMQTEFQHSMSLEHTWEMTYAQIPKDEESNKIKNIDKMILEKMLKNNLCVFPGKFKWQDIGKWDALVMVEKINNAIIDSIEIIGVDINNKLIYSNGNYTFKSYHKEDVIANYRFIWLYCNPDKNREEIMDIIVKHDDYKGLNFVMHDINNFK